MKNRYQTIKKCPACSRTGTTYFGTGERPFNRIGLIKHIQAQAHKEAFESVMFDKKIAMPHITFIKKSMVTKKIVSVEFDL